MVIEHAVSPQLQAIPLIRRGRRRGAAIAVAFGVIVASLATMAWTVVGLRTSPHLEGTTSEYWIFGSEIAAKATLEIVGGLGDRSLEIGPDGLSTAKAVQPDSIASVQREFPGPLARIGVTAAFPAVSPDSKALETGDLILRVSTGPLTASNGADRTQTAPNSGIVFSFGARHWYIGIQDGDKPAEVLHSGSFEPALYGRRSVDVIRWKEQVRIELPDGSAKLISDPRIADWSGPWASWGLHKGAQADRMTAINQLWAGW